MYDIKIIQYSLWKYIIKYEQTKNIVEFRNGNQHVISLTNNEQEATEKYIYPFILNIFEIIQNCIFLGIYITLHIRAYNNTFNYF